MHQMIKCILITSTMYLSYAELIYPMINKQYKTQWEDNLWLNCETKSQILPSKCHEGELDWQECYVVPKEGLCLINDITTTHQGVLEFNITFNSSSNKEQLVDIEINKNKVQWQINQSSILEGEKIDSDTIGLKILTSQLVLSDLTISTNRINYRDDIGQVPSNTVCEDNYFFFNYKCIPQSCADQISQITTGTHISSTSQIEQNTTNLLITSTFNIPLIECLIPKVYLTKSIEDNTITTILTDEQVKLNVSDTAILQIYQVFIKQLSYELILKEIVKQNQKADQYKQNSNFFYSNKILQYYLTPEQFQNCQQIETQDAFVYQCFIGVAITVNKVSQYLLMLISQIEVYKSTQAYTNSIQIFEMPTSDTETSIIGPIIIFSDASNSIIDTNNKLIQTTQNILDPNYQDYEVNFLNGTITQNSQIIPLTLEDEKQSGSVKELLLSYDNSNFDQNQHYNISISSSLTTNSARRLLGQRNIIPQMQIQNDFDGTKVQYQKVSFYSNQQSPLNGGYLALIFIAVILFSLFFIIATIVIVEKVENKYFKIKQNDDKRIPTDPQQN